MSDRQYMNSNGTRTTLYALCRALCRDEPEWAASRIRDLEARLARVRELPGKLRKPSAHTCASENADVYAAYDRGRKSAADELEAALQSAAGPGSNQPELDNPKSEG